MLLLGTLWIIKKEVPRIPKIGGIVDDDFSDDIKEEKMADFEEDNLKMPASGVVVDQEKNDDHEDEEEDSESADESASE